MSSRSIVLLGLVLISCVGMSLAAKQSIIAATSYTYSNKNPFLSVSEYLDYIDNPALCKRGYELANQASSALQGYSKKLAESRNLKPMYENYLQRLKVLYAKLESNQVPWETSTFQDCFVASLGSNLIIQSRASQEMMMLSGIRSSKGSVPPSQNKSNILYVLKEYMLDIEKFIQLTIKQARNSDDLNDLAKDVRNAQMRCNMRLLQVQQESKRK